MSINLLTLYPHRISSFDEMNLFLKNFLDNYPHVFKMHNEIHSRDKKKGQDLQLENHSKEDDWDYIKRFSQDYYKSLDDAWNVDDYVEISFRNAPILNVRFYSHIAVFLHEFFWEEFLENPVVINTLRHAYASINQSESDCALFLPDSQFLAARHEYFLAENPFSHLNDVKKYLEQECGMPAPMGWLDPWRELTTGEGDYRNSLYFLDDFKDISIKDLRMAEQKVEEILLYTKHLIKKHGISLPAKGFLDCSELRISVEELIENLFPNTRLIRHSYTSPSIQGNQMSLYLDDKILTMNLGT